MAKKKEVIGVKALQEALRHSVCSLTPRAQWENPVMFLVWLTAVLASVLVLAGADPAQLAEEAAPTLEEAVAAARTLQAGGMPPSAAAKQAAAGTPFSKGQIYKELIK